MIPERTTQTVHMQVDGVNCIMHIPTWKLHGRFAEQWVKCIRYEDTTPVSEHDIPSELFTNDGIASIKTGGHTYRFKGKIE